MKCSYPSYDSNDNCHPINEATDPAVEKIVYSTCSIYPEENEQVVLAALRSTEAIAGEFNLASRTEVLPAWPRRGRPGILNDAGGFYAHWHLAG